MRPVQIPVTNRLAPPPPQQASNKRWAWIAAALIVIVMLVLSIATAHGSATKNSIRSGFTGACLDAFHSETANGTPVDTAGCNGTAAQNWTTTAFAIYHQGTNTCVSADSKGSIILNTCSNNPGQVWLRDNQGYYNPNSGKCLSADKVGVQLQLGSCSNMTAAGVSWMPDSAAKAPACRGNKSELLACQAATQWSNWVAQGSNHTALLTNYTDGTPSEPWCADFISYIYKQAGYPFTSGSADGWDQDNANAVQNMGFTMHQADGSYQPKPGDVAFFSYPGGHVEMVVSGGSKPTFIYGDSAEIDPTTGNGQMKANTITQDSSGQLEYYLSPN